MDQFSDAKILRIFIFCFNIMVKRKCHVYSFVERVELYRLAYGSIFSANDFREKNSSEVGSQFFTLFQGFFEAVTEVNPSYPSKGKS